MSANTASQLEWLRCTEDGHNFIIIYTVWQECRVKLSKSSEEIGVVYTIKPLASNARQTKFYIEKVGVEPDTLSYSDTIWWKNSA